MDNKPSLRRPTWRQAVALLTAALACTGAAAQTAAPAAPDARPMQVLRDAHWIAEGSVRPQHVLYVFLDPNCPFCHKLWLALQPYYGKGLQVRDLLVGIIGPSSPGKAAAILAAHDPGAALRQNEQRWGSRNDGGGGLAPQSQPDEAASAVLAHDLALMQAFGFQGTPGIVWFDARGQAHGADGLPAAAQIAQIVQQAAVPVSATPAPGPRAAGSPR